MHSFSFGEIALIFGIVVILFGGSRLASIGKSLGEGISNFKKGLNSSSNTEETESDSVSQTKPTSYQPPQVSASKSNVHKKSEHIIDVEQNVEHK